jgi:uncharacterized protein
MILTIPGLWSSGPEHWQTHWERERPACRRVEQRDWETPSCADWVRTLDDAIRAAPDAVILAGHSLGCATIAHWARTAGPDTIARVRGALLVAPSDVEAPKYPPGTTGFVPMPRERLPFASIVALSSDDEWVSPERARAFAADWGSEVVDVGPKGHINGASRLGAWDEGWALVARLHG